MPRTPEEVKIWIEDGWDPQDWYPELEPDDEDDYPRA